MATETWTGGTTGSFLTPTDWSQGTVPGSADDVAITSGATVDVPVGGPAISIDSLTLATGNTLAIDGSFFTIAGGVSSSNAGVIVVSAATLNLLGTIAQSGAIDIAGSGALADLENTTIIGGTLDGSGGGVVSVVAGDSGVFDDVTNLGSVQVADESALYLQGVIDNQGSLLLEDSFHGSDLAVDTPSVTLAGIGTITLQDFNGGDYIYAATAGDTLVNLGNLIDGSGDIGNATSLAVINAGTIEATGTADQLVIDALAGITNTGLLASTSALGLFIDGTVADAGGTIAAIGAAGTVFLTDADIEGGTLETSGGTIELPSVNSVATLDGVLNSGLLLVLSTALHLRGSLDNAGTVALASNSPYGPAIEIDTAIVTLHGGGTIALADDGQLASVIAGTAGDTLDNLDNLIIGVGNIGGNTDLVLINAATIDAVGTASELTIDALGGVINSGLIEATGTKGLLVISTVANAGGTIAAIGSLVPVLLDAGDIVGGTLVTSGGGIIETAPGGSGTFDGTTNTGSVLVTDETALHLRGTLVNAGNVALDGTYIGADIFLDTPTVTLSGGGTIDLLDGDDTDYIVAGTAGDTLDNRDNLIIGAGNIGNATSLGLVNAGTIEATGTAYGLTINAHDGVINTGLLAAASSFGLTIDSVVANAGGTIDAIGPAGTIFLTGADIEGGTLRTPGGGTIELPSINSQATLDGVLNEGLVRVLSTTLHLRDSLSNAGTVGLSSNSPYGQTIDIDTTTVTLSGGGTIAMAEGGQANLLTAGISPATLDNVDNLIIGVGAIGNGASLALVNFGTIDGDGTATALTIDASAGITNSGLIEATGTGGLTFAGASTIANAGGELLASGGTIGFGTADDIKGGTLAGTALTATSLTLDGSAAPLVIAAGSTVTSQSGSLALLGTVTDFGSLIADGALDGAATLVVSDGGLLLAGAAVASASTIDFVGSGDTLALRAPQSFAGTLAGFALGSTIDLVGIVPSTVSLVAGGIAIDIPASGTSTIRLAGNVSGNLQTGSDGNAGTDITFVPPASSTKTWIGGTSGSFENDGNWSPGGVPGAGNDVIIASAGADVTTSQANISINSLALAAGDTLSVGGGVFNIRDDVTSGDPAGTSFNAGVIAVGAYFGLAGTLIQTGTIAVAASYAVLSEGAIVGGTLATSGNGVFLAGGQTDPTLDGVTNTGVVLVGGDSELALADSLVNTGIVEAGTYLTTRIVIATPTFTLSGGGTIAMAPTFSDSGGAVYFTAAAAGDRLDNADNLIAGGGYLGNNSGLAITNAGTIAATDTADSLTVYAPVTNTGVIEATAGAELTIQSSTIANAGGTIAAIGSNAVVFLDAADILGGTLASSDGGMLIGSVESNWETFDGSTTPVDIVAGSTFVIPDTGALYLAGTIDNHGTLFDNGTADFADIVIASSTATLAGGGIVLLSDNADNRIDNVTTSYRALVNLDNTIAGVGQFGSTTAGRPFGVINGPAGIIDADAAAPLVFNLNGAALTNQGLIEATGAGGLQFTSGMTIDNAGGTLLAAGVAIALTDLDVAGGTLAASGGAPFSASGATLDGSATPLVIAAGATVGLATNQALTLLGTIALAGSLFDDDTNSNYDSNIVVGAQAVTLTGSGTLALSDDPSNRIYGSGTAADTLVNAATIAGAGQLGIGSDITPLALANAAGGVIDAVGNNPLVIQTGGPVLGNAGLIEATGSGGLVVEDATTISNIGANTGTLLADGAAILLQANATIRGGILASSGDGAITAADASLDGSTAPVTIAAGGLVEVPTNAPLSLLGTIDLLGTLLDDDTNSNYASDIILAAPTVTLTGNGALLLSDNPSNRVYGQSATTETLVNAAIIAGAGQLGVANDILPLALVNATGGTVDAVGANALVIQTGGPTLRNAGLIEATGSGGLQVTAGTTIANSGTLLAAGAGILIEDGAGIAGGTLAASGSQFTIDNATLDGSVAPIVLTAVVSVPTNADLTLLGTIDLSGTILDDNTNSNYFSDIVVASTLVSLSGSGALILSNSPSNRIYDAEGTAGTLVNEAIIAGAGQLGVANGILPLVLVNQAGGTVDATGATALVIQTGGPALQNAGLIEATGAGGLQITESSTIANSGTVLAAGGPIVLADGADIAGGTLAASGAGSFTAEAGSLDGTAAVLTVAAGAVVDIPTDAALSLLGTIDLLGSLFDDNTNSNYNSDIVLAAPTVTLAGTGALILSDSPSNRVYGASSADDTLVNAATIAGAGQLGDASNTTPLALVNAAAGVIDATDNTALIVSSGGPGIVNDGVIEATGGASLQFSAGLVDGRGGGTIAANGGIVTLPDVDVVSGTLDAVTVGTLVGALSISGSPTLDGSSGKVSNLGLLQVAAQSVVALLGTIDNAGSIALGSGSVLQIGTASGAGVTLTGGGSITLAADQLVAGGAAESLTDLGDTLLGSGTFGSGVAITLGAAGVIESTGTVAFETGTAALLNGGLVEASPGALLLIGDGVADDGGTISPNGGTVEFSGADLFGGTIGSGLGVLQVTGNSVFDGSVTPFGNLGVLLVDGGVTLALRGTIDNSGVIQLGSLSALQIGTASADGVTLSGGGTVSLAADQLQAAGSGDSLTVLDNTILGTGTFEGGVGITLGAGGMIESGGTLALATGTAAIANAGMLEASTDTTLLIESTVDSVDPGTISTNGGTVDFAGADIVGGSLVDDSGAFVVSSLSTLDGSQQAVSASGVLGIAAGAALALLGTFGGGTLGVSSGASLRVGGATLSGGMIALGGSAAVVGGVVGGELLENDASIAGGGSLGDGSLSLLNDAAGSIVATTGLLVLDAGTAGTIVNAGLIEADLAPLTIAEGTLVNGGTVAALNATLALLGGAVLTSQAGTLGGGTWVASGAAGTLAFGGAAITDLAADVVLSGPSSGLYSGPDDVGLEQSLQQIDAGGTLDLTGGRVFAAVGGVANAGTILLAGGGFASFALFNQGVIAGSGTLAGSIANAGSVVASAGTLSIGAADGAGALIVGSGADLVLSGGAAGGTVDFAGAGVLTVAAGASLADTVAGFATGDAIDFVGVGVADALRYDASTNSVTLYVEPPPATGVRPTPTPVATVSFSGSYDAGDFSFRSDTSGQGTEIVPCFLAGTKLLTRRGEVAVEDLRIGDVAITQGGQRKIVWIGERRVRCAGHPRPELVRPVRIRAGAFGDGRPARDLLLSPDHAVAWDAVLIPAWTLLNGATVVQERAATAWYFHVELDRHDVVSAEGLWVESYLDTGNRGQFSGGAAWTALHPDFSPLGWADACRALCCAGAPVAAARAHLLQRTAALGFARGAADLVVQAGGRRWHAVRQHGSLRRFLLPPSCGSIDILSSSLVPDVGDRRVLGARIGGIVVGGREMALDDAALAAGFYDVEREAGQAWRWTDGAARLALPPQPAPQVLDLLVTGLMAGWRGSGQPRWLVAHPGIG